METQTYLPNSSHSSLHQMVYATFQKKRDSSLTPIHRLSSGFLSPLHQHETIRRDEIVEGSMFLGPSTISSLRNFDAVERAEKPRTQIIKSKNSIKSWSLTATKAAAICSGIWLLYQTSLEGASPSFTPHSFCLAMACIFAPTLTQTLSKIGRLIFKSGAKQSHYHQTYIMEKLAHYADQRGCDSYNEGFCHGLAILNMLYHFLGIEDQFYERIDRILQIDLTDRDLSSHTYQDLMQEEREIEHFFNDIYFLHCGVDCTDITQMHPEQLFSITSSKKEKNFIRSVFYFSSFFMFDDGTQRFKTFEECLWELIITDNEKKKCILITVENHTVNIFSDGKSCYFYDSNKDERSLPLPLTKKSIQLIVANLLDEKKIICSSIDLFMEEELSDRESLTKKIDPKIILEIDDNNKSNCDYSPFQDSVQLGRPQFLRKLIEKGVFPHQIEISEIGLLSPFHLAIDNNNIDIVEELLKHEMFDPNIFHKDYGTPLFLSIRKNLLPIVQKLLSTERTDPMLVDAKGHSPLMEACFHGHVAIVSLLLGSKRVDCNHRAHNGWSALHVAAYKGHLAIIELLLAHKAASNSYCRADCTIQANDGRTALDLATDNGHLTIVELLLKEKIAQTACSRDG